MMFYKIQLCDICGAEITSDDIKYKFKSYGHSYTGCEDLDFFSWTKLDMCESCFVDLQQFIKEKR